MNKTEFENTYCRHCKLACLHEESGCAPYQDCEDDWSGELDKVINWMLHLSKLQLDVPFNILGVDFNNSELEVGNVKQVEQLANSVKADVHYEYDKAYFDYCNIRVLGFDGLIRG